MTELSLASERLIDQPDFVRFWCARTASSVTNQVFAVAVGWRVYALTHSATMLGLIGIAQFVPMVLVTLFAGLVADRFNRRRVIAGCQASSACINFLLCVALLLGRDRVGLLFAMVTMAGTVRSFEMASIQAMLPMLVPILPVIRSRVTSWSLASSRNPRPGR